MKKAILLFLSIMYLTAGAIPAQNNTYNIVPFPVSLKPSSGRFILNEQTRILLPNGDIEMHHAAFSLVERMLIAAGIHIDMINVKDTSVKAGDNMIIFNLVRSVSNREGYVMKITEKRIEVNASAAAGFFYAMQTIRQLLPPEIESDRRVANISWAIPCAVIEDAPRYSYRGLMLDVCRHFSNVMQVKRYIDKLAFHKINTFHWHLTDDQGWRIDIKAYPKLAEVSAWRNRTLIGHLSANAGEQKYNQTRYGGIYSQDEIREVVEYAKTKFITVIPEIEMPGHAVAALAAYPNLSCSGGPFDVEGRWGVFNDVYCTREETFQFLEGVLSEVMDLFPAKYIHIGGDECPKTRWQRCYACQMRMKELGLKDEHELQSYFIRRIEQFVNSKGKQIIGWEEILEGGLAPNATVMSWRGTEGGIEAAKQGHDVIMTPGDYCYFDRYQSQDRSEEPLAIGGYLPLEKVYEFDPTPAGLKASEAKHILGGQANLWREYITSDMLVEYMLFPRLAALSEAVWTPGANKNYDGFKSRLTGILKHYDSMNIRYSKSNL